MAALPDAEFPGALHCVIKETAPQGYLQHEPHHGANGLEFVYAAAGWSPFALLSFRSISSFSSILKPRVYIYQSDSLTLLSLHQSYRVF